MIGSQDVDRMDPAPRGPDSGPRSQRFGTYLPAPRFSAQEWQRSKRVRDPAPLDFTE